MTTESAEPEVNKPDDTNLVPGRHARPSIDPIYEFNAPQFHDFTNARDDPIAAESYFEDGRRITIYKPRVSTGEQPETIQEEGQTKDRPETGPELQPVELKCETESAEKVMPESPGLRVPTHSVLNPEPANQLPDVSKRENQIPGFMRSCKSEHNKDKLQQQQQNGVDASSKAKKRPAKMVPSEGRFRLEIVRNSAPKCSEELELEKIRQEMQAAAALREKNKARVLQMSKSESSIGDEAKSTKKKSTVTKPPTVKKERGRPDIGTKSFQSGSSVSNSDRGRSRTRSEQGKQRVPSPGFNGPRSRSRSISVNSLRSQPTTRPNSDSVSFTPLTIQTNSYFAQRSDSKCSEVSFPIRTLPQEFHLSTPRRSTKVLSTEEKELLEIKQHAQFKARKMPKKVLQSTGDVGVPRIRKKSPTIAEEFSFASRKVQSNARSSSSIGCDSKEFSQFKARPVPQSVLKQTPGRPKSAPLRCTTIPKSPRLTKPKPRSVPNPEPVPEPEFHARPMPDFSRTPQIPSVPVRAPTQPDPFPLKTEERGKIKAQQFKDLITAEMKASEELRMYKARPLIFTSPKQIQHGTVHVTEPKPFSLRSEEISKKIKETFQKRVEDEREKENELFSCFKAKVPLHQIQEPFVPVPVHHDPIIPEPFHLVSEDRALKRANFDLQIKLQHQEAAAAREARKREKEKSDLESLIASLDAVAFKARPFKMSSGFEITKSTLPLTTPLSPNFATDKRLKKAATVKAA